MVQVYLNPKTMTLVNECRGMVLKDNPTMVGISVDKIVQDVLNEYINYKRRLQAEQVIKNSEGSQNGGGASTEKTGSN